MAWDGNMPDRRLAAETLGWGSVIGAVSGKGFVAQVRLGGEIDRISDNSIRALAAAYADFNKGWNKTDQA
jgi:hypothetical protein